MHHEITPKGDIGRYSQRRAEYRVVYSVPRLLAVGNRITPAGSPCEMGLVADQEQRLPLGPG